MTLWIIIFAIGALGALLVGLGIRGKRISDHPWCRRCRYDLFGVYPPAMSNEPDSPANQCIAIVRCPECGLVLSDRRSVRWGYRACRRSWIIIGVLSIVVAGVTGGTTRVITVSHINLRHYLPIWALRLDAHSSNRKHVSATYVELMARQKAGALSVQTMVAIGLAVQGDGDAAWIPVWGDFIEQAWASGKLTPEQKTTYARQSSSVRFQTSESIIGDKPFEWSAQITSYRAGTGDQLQPFALMFVFDGLALGGAALPLSAINNAPSSMSFPRRNEPKKWVNINGDPLKVNFIVFAPKGSSLGVILRKRLMLRGRNGTISGRITAHLVAYEPPEWPGGSWGGVDVPDRTKWKFAEWSFSHNFQTTFMQQKQKEN